MPTLYNTPQIGHGPHCTRQQARQLLEDLRAAYQSLSTAERGLVKSVIAQVERAQFVLEME